MDPETMALMAELAALENKLARLGVKKERGNFGNSMGSADNLPPGGNFGSMNRMNNNPSSFPPPGLDSLLPSNNRRNSQQGFNNIIRRNNHQSSRNMFGTTSEPTHIQPLTNDFAQIMQAMGGGNGLSRQNNMLQSAGSNGLRLRDNTPPAKTIEPTPIISSNDIFTPGLGGNHGGGGSLSNNLLNNPGRNTLGNFMPPHNPTSGSNSGGGLSNILGPSPPRMSGGLDSILNSRNGPPSPQMHSRKPSAGPSGGPMGGGINPLMAGFATRNQMADALDTHMDNMADYIEFMQNRNHGHAWTF